MPSQLPQDGQQSSSSLLLQPLATRSRGNSVNSVSSLQHVDKDTFTQALDHIHSTASRTSTLTTFNDFAPPPAPSTLTDERGRTGQNVPSALGGIYTKLKASVSGAKDAKLSPDRPLAGEARSRNLSRGNRPAALSKSGRNPESPSTSFSTINITSPSLKGSFSSPSRSVHAPSNSDLSSIQPSTYSGAIDEAEDVRSVQEPFPRLPSPPPDTPIIEIGDTSHERREATAAVPKLALTKATTNTSSMTDAASSENKNIGNVVIRLDTRKSTSKASQRSQQFVKEDGQPTQSDGVADIGSLSGNKYAQIRSAPSPIAPELLSQPPTTAYRPGSVRTTISDVSDTHSSFTFPASPTVRVSTASSVAVEPKTRIQVNSSANSGGVHPVRRKVLSREYWMKDENAKACFNCGDGFSTFRRKHHCRLCGNIFCSSCTNLVTGRPFGQTSKLRVCKKCEVTMNADDSSDYTDDDEPIQAQPLKQIRFSEMPDEVNLPSRIASHEMLGELDRRSTPSNNSTTARKSREVKRRSLQGAASDRQPTLARPASSRSLKSLNLRPRSSSQKQRRLRHQHVRSLGVAFDDGAPFSQRSTEFSLPIFHTDSVIDPDLAPFMSDEGSSEEEGLSIAATLSSSAQDHPGTLPQTFLGALKRGRPQSNGKAFLEVGRTRGETDDASITSSRVERKRRQIGSRTVSVGSLGHYGSTPRVIRSDNLFASSDNLLSLASRSGGTGRHPVPGDGDFDLYTTATSRRIENPGADLNRASLDYVKRLLRQFLDDAGLKTVRQWEKALIPLLLRCAEDVDPNIHRGDDIDIRHYVKMKKAPGGSPSDTSYVSGVVFTKNLALKDMPRSIEKPRILLVSFALVYARHQQHFMSLEPIIAQEREYLRNLVKRIKELRPQVLLVQREVAGLAIQFLHEARIAVAYNVKPSVLLAVARFTQTRIVASAEKLNISPHALGRCDAFDVKTYLHGNQKKTFISLSGCPRDLGCTIVLRGGSEEALHKVKWIAEFMCYVTYNLKLETCLMRDEFVSTPSIADLESLPENKPVVSDVLDNKERLKQDEKNVTANNRGTESTRSKDTSEKSAEKHRITEYPKPIGPYDVLVQESQQRLLSVSPFVKLPEPYLIKRGREQEEKMAHLRVLRGKESQREVETEKFPTLKFELLKTTLPNVTPEDASQQTREVLRATHDGDYDKAEYTYNTLKRRWETYISGVQDPFSPTTHQRIIVLFSLVSTPTWDACEGPDLLGMDFYQEHDIDEGLVADEPLGFYVERLCEQANSPCIENRCDRNMIDHHRQYVHGEGQVSVYVRKYPSRYRGMENTILMWSCCRKCDHETQVTPMSINSWKYSFGKYLELSFWSSHLHPRAGSCPHDIHRDHKRYFGFKNLAVTVQYDPIRIVEVAVPRATITWGVERCIALKNDEFTKIEEKLVRFMSSVKIRIKSINVESIAAEKAEDCKAEVEKLSKKANEEYDALMRKLQDKYMTSKYYEIIPLNRAMRLIQEKVAEWDIAFADFARDYFPSERDIRRLATQQLRKVFLEREEINNADGDAEEQNQELQEKEDNQTTGETGDPEKILLESGSESDSAPLQLNTTDLTDPQRLEANSHPGAKGVMASKLQEHEKQIVQNLDLAVPLASPDNVGLSRQATEADTILSPVAADVLPSNTNLIKPSPLEADVVAKVEQMTSEMDPVVDIASSTASSTRHRNSISAPTLFRAQTQPSPSTSVVTEVNPISPQATTSPVSGFPTVPPTLGFAKPFLPTPPLSIGMMVERSGSMVPRPGKSMIPRAVPLGRTNESKVSALAKHFEEMSREFEKERLRERRQQAARNRQSRAYPMVSSQPIVELFRDAHEAVSERDASYEGLRDSSIDDKLQDSFESEHNQIPDPEETAQDTRRSSYVDELPRDSVDLGRPTDIGEEVQTHPTKLESDVEGAATDTEQPLGEDTKDADENAEPEKVLPSELEPPPDYITEIPKHEKTSLMKMLTRFWSERSESGWTPLEYPLIPTDHIFADSDVIVREDEPSSLIAWALASQDYNAKLQKFRERAMTDRVSSPPAAEAQTYEEDIDVERAMLGKTATHMKYGIQAGSARMLCKIFYAEAFDAIRKKSGVSDRFVESLSRCLKWDSKGGKTKSLFLKTLDERFVLKSLSTVETQAFLKFAPDYFDYMSKCLFHQLPSAIAKMFGFYQIVIKNPATGTELNYFLQIMENVFYEGPSDRMFDLKGSMRNRRIQSTGERDEVLLDENLLDYISQSPVYVRAHSNATLASSIANDTLFCSKQNVMDYSLIVGLYDDTAELRVGIIDYIRTYTWDKKLESWIKDRGKHKPTVMSPKAYRNRFRASIPRYFPLVPSCWQVFGLQQRGEGWGKVPWVGGAGEGEGEGQGMALALGQGQGHGMRESENGVEQKESEDVRDRE